MTPGSVDAATLWSWLADGSEIALLDVREAGLRIEATPGLPADRDCLDFLFFLHDRHAGNLESARRYLAWETGLLQELDPEERASFRRELVPADPNMAISRRTLEPF